MSVSYNNGSEFIADATLAACLSVFIGTQVFLIMAILRNAHGLIAMHPNAARCNAMTAPVSRYARMLAPVSRCAGPCPDAGAIIVMYFTGSRCCCPYPDVNQCPQCNKIITSKFTFLLMGSLLPQNDCAFNDLPACFNIWSKFADSGS